MPKIKRPRIAHTEDWAVIQQRMLWPETESPHYPAYSCRRPSSLTHNQALSPLC